MDCIDDPVILSRVVSELFYGTAVRFDRDQYGVQSVAPDGSVTLGWKLASTFDIGTLLHECCHFVEIDEPRMNKPAWGLKFGKPHYVPGRYGNIYYEPRTMQATARELRVMAMQHHAHEHFGMPTWRESVSSLTSNQIDWYAVPGSSAEARGRWMLSHYDRLVASPRYRYAEFLAEWQRRNVVLAKRIARQKRTLSIGTPSTEHASP